MYIHLWKLVCCASREYCVTASPVHLTTWLHILAFRTKYNLMRHVRTTQQSNVTAVFYNTSQPRYVNIGVIWVKFPSRKEHQQLISQLRKVGLL